MTRAVSYGEKWAITCPNPECDDVGVEIEAPGMILVSQHLATRPEYICIHCGWPMQRLPDRPVELRLTEEEADLLARAISVAAAEATDDVGVERLRVLRAKLP